MTKFDVVHIGFLTGHGGDALQMLTLASKMNEARVRTKVIVPDNDDSLQFAARCSAAGVECERSHLIKGDMSGPRQSIWSCLELLRRTESDLLHFHSGHSHLPRAAMVAAEVSRITRAVATIQSPYEAMRPRTLRARSWATLANRRLGAVISPSQHGTEFQIRCGVSPERAITIPNAVDVRAARSGDAAAPRALLGLNQGDEVVLFSSRLDSQKRPLDALAAFAQLAEAFPRAHLVYVGSGSEEAGVKEAAAKAGLSSRVHLVGYQTHIADWLALATVWLLPTERENFSVALLEALAAGCAVVSTDCPGNNEVLRDGENALVVPVGDVHAMARAIATLLSTPELRARLGAAASLTSDRYSADSQLRSVLETYRLLSMTSTGSPRPTRND